MKKMYMCFLMNLRRSLKEDKELLSREVKRPRKGSVCVCRKSKSSFLDEDERMKSTCSRRKGRL